MGGAAERSAAIFGCAGLSLSQEERQFFKDADPFGFILFARNIDTPEQVRRLVDDLRDSVGRVDSFVLIDQEGGRVARLPSPPWRDTPPAGRIGALYESDPAAGVEAARLNGRLLADELAALGINVDCVPVLDLQFPDTHRIIGDRSFGSKAAAVAALGRAQCEGVMAGGVLPVIKHIPGHGRATLDSHEALPAVDTPRVTLEKTDFAPFRDLSDMPMAMTAHVVFGAIDSAAPATTSPTVIRDIIRGFIGFDGLLLSDDLSMSALTGSLGERSKAARDAGCDIMLHCNGILDEMTAVTANCGSLSDAASARAARATALLHPAVPDDEALQRFEALMAGETPLAG
ncbi:MAG: beta-N-acetylhexosaminidase [Alphaproteobacteria bacterium]|nr:beta-N-acetylhexosaminidase [Alphaproteobacteria bacterium]